MAVTRLVGFETQAAASEGITLTGTAAISTSQARTGAASLRCNPASGASGFFNASAANSFVHFGLYVATLPSVARVIQGASGAGFVNTVLNTGGTLSIRSGTTVIGTSSAAFASPGWHWVGIRNVGSATGVLLQIDGIDEVSGTNGASSSSAVIGVTSSEASAIDLYMDDVIIDGAGFLGSSNVALLVPISDGTIGTGWLSDDGTAPGFDTLDNKPPDGIADTQASTGLHQARHAASNTNAYDMNLTTYTTAGVGASDTILAVQPIAVTGAPSATSPKSGSLTLSNPTIAKATIGTFYNGSAVAATFPTGWIRRELAILTSPGGITLGNSPVLTVTNDTSSTRVALVCFEGVYVAWTPAVGGGGATEGWDPMGMAGIFGV